MIYEAKMSQTLDHKVYMQIEDGQTECPYCFAMEWPIICLHLVLCWTKCAWKPVSCTKWHRWGWWLGHIQCTCPLASGRTPGETHTHSLCQRPAIMSLFISTLRSTLRSTQSMFRSWFQGVMVITIINI